MLFEHTINKRKKVSIVARLFFILFIVLLGLPLLNTYATPLPPNPTLVTAYQDILKLKLDEGKRKLSETTPSKVDLPFYLYVENLADILELLLTEDKVLYDQQKMNEKERLKKLQSIPDNNPYKLFCEAEIKLHWAFAKLKFGEEMSAVWSLRQAYKIIALNIKNHPEFIPNKKTYGLLVTLFGTVPPQYHWLLNILGLKGSTTEGMEQLTAIANSKEVFSFECKIIACLAEVYLMDNREGAINSFRFIVNNSKDNKLVLYLYAMILIKTNNAAEAIKALENTTALQSDYLSLSMVDYLRGEVLLQKGLYQKAAKSFHAFLALYKGNNFVKDAYYKLFLSAWLLGNEEEAEDYFSKAKQSGSTAAEADKYAAKQVATGVYPEKTILKIRLATDGGFYQEAASLVNSHSEETFPSYHDKVEFIYRKARLLDKQGKVDDAIIHYIETIDRSGNNLWYFAPNAALHLGYIYMKKGDLTAAKNYFEKAMRYEGHEYKNSIDNKAKIALQKL